MISHDMGYMACVIATHKVLQLWPLNGTLSVSDSLSIVCVRRKGGARTSCGEQVRPPHGKGNGTLHSFPIRRQICVTGLFKMRIPTHPTALIQPIGFVCIPPASQPSLDTPPPSALHVRRIDTRNKEGWRVGIGEITAGRATPAGLHMRGFTHVSTTASIVGLSHSYQPVPLLVLCIYGGFVAELDWHLREYQGAYS